MNKFMNYAANLAAENRLIKMGFVVCLMITLLNSYSISTMDNKVRTHVIPIGANGKFEFTGNKASDEYLTSIMQYVVFMSGNVTAQSIDHQLTDLLSLFHSSVYGIYKDEFRDWSQSVQKYSSIYFTTNWRHDLPLEITDNKLTKQIEKRRVVGNSVKSVVSVVVSVSYVIENGRFWITEFRMEDV